MPNERYKHIFLEGPTYTQGYTNPRRGGQHKIPPQERIEHSNYLRQRLDEAWREIERQSQAVAHVERLGAYLDFLSEPGFRLLLKSLDAPRTGIRLLNVRKVRSPEGEQTFATVYVPHKQRGHFLRKIDAYANEESKTGKPKNQKLVDSISDIRCAVLESFWQDDLSLMPGDNTASWTEVWLSSDQDSIYEKFETLIREHQIDKADGVIRFPERTVLMIFANRSQLNDLITLSDDIAEFRLAKQVASFFIETENKQQTDLVRTLLDRTEIDQNSDVVVCILDSGVNNGHLLIQPVLSDADLHTVVLEWGTNDHEGHGTLMAGMAAFGDILEALQSHNRIRITHRLESAKILPPPPDQNPPRLWGYMVAQGIYLAEIQEPYRKRIGVLAVTSTDFRDRGRPSSWSGKLDELAFGHDDRKRLMIISSGNVDESDSWLRYFDDNLTNEVHDPGQAWNVLTVGAYTEKVNIRDQSLASYSPVAPVGGLSPFSTTSNTWSPHKWPVKPEILLEGGNVAKGPNESIFDTEDLKLISTSHTPTVAQFAPFCGTSSAAAYASWMAAKIQALYPDAWPETIRALIVHSSEWTDTMKRQFLKDDSKASYARLLRICGYGVPNLDLAVSSGTNSLTLVSQAELQPYDKHNGSYITRDMHLYKLPWPSEALRDLGETQVVMRVTLSYFIEPGPGEVGWQDRYRYPSHALRFELNGPGESEDDFIRRVNCQARDDDQHPGTEGPSSKWVIGSARDVGSIHSDRWKGTAVELSLSNLIVIHPAVGWWRERQHLKRWNKHCRYSLIVTIQTPVENVDIYSPVAIQLGIKTPIQVTVS